MTQARAQSVGRGIARLTCFAVALAAGCVVNEPATPSTGVSVSGPPPAPIAETERPPAPAPRAAWVAGYWHWTGVHYTWIPGHWEQAPPGATWSAPQYVHRDGSYFYRPGGWQGGEQKPANANAFR